MDPEVWSMVKTLKTFKKEKKERRKTRKKRFTKQKTNSTKRRDSQRRERGRVCSDFIHHDHRPPALPKPHVATWKLHARVFPFEAKLLLRKTAHFVLGEGKGYPSCARAESMIWQRCMRTEATTPERLTDKRRKEQGGKALGNETIREVRRSPSREYRSRKERNCQYEWERTKERQKEGRKERKKEKRRERERERARKRDKDRERGGQTDNAR